MFSIGDDVEICFEKGGECAIKYNDKFISGIVKFKILLEPKSYNRECTICRSTDRETYLNQLALASELAGNGFNIVWQENPNGNLGKEVVAIRNAAASGKDWLY